MTNKPRIKATTIRTTMSAIIVMTIGLSILGFYFAQDMLKTFEVEVDSVVSRSTLNQASSGQTKMSSEDIAKYTAPYNKALSLTTPIQDYKTTITKDLNQYASINGISITDFSFSSTAIMTNATLQNSGISTNQVTIKLSNPVSFTGLMQFLKSIENSAPKLQLMGINLTSIPSSDNNVTVEPLIIEFYTR